MSQIANLIRRMGGASAPAFLVCEVTAVNAQERSIDCTPLDESAPLVGVNLQSGQEGEVGITLFPRVGSHVLVGLLADGNAGAVLLTDDVERVEMAIRSGGKSLTLTATEDGLVIDEGKHGGLVKVSSLTERLNALERDLNALRNIFTAWTPVPTDGGTALKTALTAWAAQPLPLTDRTELENERIKQ